MRGLRALLVLAPLLVMPGLLAGSPQSEGAGATAEVTDLVNTMLGALMGEAEITGEQLQREVAEAGGIPFRYDVPIAFMGRADLVDYLRDVLDAEYSPERAEADQRLLRAFGLLGPGTDLRALRARLLEENVVGFYDERPGRRQLFAVSEEEAFTPMNQIVLAHELRHALQDQYENLHWQLPEEIGDFDDRRMAWMSLLEGDATLVMERFLLSRLGGLGQALPGGLGSASYSDLPLGGVADIPGAPPVIRDHLVKPYLVGRDLARAIEAREGADGMRDAWRRPPDSTEQVLHPEKFFLREPPRMVTPRLSPPGGRLVSQGVLGELLLQSLLEETGAAPGAAGWGGDAWRLWDLEGRTVLVWKSAWDSLIDAGEFEDALGRRLARRGARLPARGPWSVFEAEGGWRFALRRQADVVDLVSADDRGAFEALLE